VKIKKIHIKYVLWQWESHLKVDLKKFGYVFIEDPIWTGGDYKMAVTGSNREPLVELNMRKINKKSLECFDTAMAVKDFIAEIFEEMGFQVIYDKSEYEMLVKERELELEKKREKKRAKYEEDRKSKKNGDHGGDLSNLSSPSSINNTGISD